MARQLSAEAYAKIKEIEAVGEEEIFERVAAGESYQQLVIGLGVGYRTFNRWLDMAEGRRQAFEAARAEAAHFYAYRALDTAQNTDPSTAASDRLKVDTDKWMASKLNASYDTRQRDVAINVSISDLHAQAAQLLASVGGDVIDGDAVEVSDDDDVDG